MHLQFAYYESNLAVEFLISRFGAETLKAILLELGEGHEINQVIAKHTAPMNQLETQFASFARDRALQMAPGLDWEQPGAKMDGGDLEMMVELPRRSRNRTPAVGEAEWTKWAEQRPTNFWVMTRKVHEAVRSKDWESARPILEKLVELYPDCTGTDSPYPLLVMVLQSQSATNAELAVLSEYARRDSAAPDAYARLMELCRSSGDWKGVKLNAERYLAVNPLVPIPHRFLAEASENLGELPEAIQAYRALLELGPEDPAETHYRLARALYATGKPEAKRQVLQALEEAPRYRAALKLLLDIERKNAESTMSAAPEVNGAR
jgi:tetratricopeptide (TPR) repeat protein